jgi:hypothetical protein
VDARQEPEDSDVSASQRRTTPEERNKLVGRAARTRRANKKTPATSASRAEGSEHAVAQSARTPGGDAARGELFAGVVRAARRVVAQKAKKTKAVRRRAAKSTGKKR